MKTREQNVVSANIDLPSSHLDENQLAARLGVKLSTVKGWRTRGFGPPWLKYTRSHRGAVRYRLADVIRWEEEQRHVPPNMTAQKESPPAAAVTSA